MLIITTLLSNNFKYLTSRQFLLAGAARSHMPMPHHVSRV